MTGDDWQDPGLRVIGMFVSGDPLRSPGPRGEQQRDTQLHALAQRLAPATARSPCPLNEWVQQGVVVLSTDPDNPARDQGRQAGETITVSARSLVLLQQT